MINKNISLLKLSCCKLSHRLLTTSIAFTGTVHKKIIIKYLMHKFSSKFLFHILSPVSNSLKFSHPQENI